MPNLNKLYRKYNRKYFNNLLPEISLYYEELEEGYHGFAKPWNYEISIHSALSGSQIRGTLLHEMIHIFEYLVEEKEYETEAEYHSIDFYFIAENLSQLSGYEVA